MQISIWSLEIGILDLFFFFLPGTLVLLAAFQKRFRNTAGKDVYVFISKKASINCTNGVADVNM